MQSYLNQWSELAKNIQKPLTELMELNLKTLQKFHYIDIKKLNKPENLFESQFNLAIQNAHNALDYLSQSFEIWEHTFLKMQENTSLVDKLMQMSQSTFEKTSKPTLGDQPKIKISSKKIIGDSIAADKPKKLTKGRRPGVQKAKKIK